MKRDAPFKLLFWWSVQTFAGSFSSTMTLLRSLYYQLWKWCATPDTSSVFTFMQSHESLMIMYKTSHLISARTEQIFFSVSYNWCSWLWDYARTECVGTNNSSSLSVYRHRVRVEPVVDILISGPTSDWYDDTTLRNFPCKTRPLPRR